MPQRSLARVAVFVLLAGCFILSEAAWSTTALSNASKKARTVVGNSPFKKQLGGGLEQGSSSFLGRKGGSAEVSSDAASGIAVDEKGKKEGSRFGFLGPSDSSKGVGVTEGGNGASNGLFVAADEESEIRGATGSLEETENSLNREKRSPYTKTKITAKARPSGALDNDTSLLAGGEAALETPLEATESDDSIVEDGRSDSGDEKSEAEAGNAEGKGWRTWGWFAKPKVVNSSELAAPSPLQAALADRANNTESEGPEVEAGDESEEGFEGGEQEENSENLGRDVDVEEDEETDDVAGEGMADLRKVILDSVARAIKGGNASEAEKLLNDLFSKKKEAGNVSSFPENLTSLSAAEPTLDSATLQLENVTSFSEAKKRVGSEEESPNARTSVWSRLVGGEEERTGSKSEGGLPKSATLAGRGSVGTASEGSEGAAQRAANSSGSDAVSSTKSGGFWGRLVGGGAKGKGKEMREEILAEPEEEGEQVGTTGVDEERISEQREEGLLRKPEEKNVGGIRVREGEESGGSTKGVNGLEDSRFGEKGKRVATKKKDEVTSSVDGEEEEEEGNEEAALPYRKQVGLGNLKKEGVDEVGARTKDGENVKTGKGKLREVPGLGVPSVLNVTTEVARLVHRAGNATLNGTRNATSFRNASVPGAAAHLLTTVQAQTARLMDNITRLTPHAGWGIPVNGSALNATDGTVPLESDASVDSSPGQAHPQVDGEAVKGGLARDLELDKGLARKRGNSWSEYDKEDGPPFAGSMFEWGAIQKQAEEHLVPHVQALSQATSDAYNSTHAQIRTTLDGVVGPKASGATATFIVMLLLLVPGAAVVVICQRLKTVFSLQMVLFVCCAYFALHSAVLTLIALVYKDPLALFQRYSPGAYVMLQFLSLLAYVIFLALCIVSFLTAVRTGELVQRGLGAGQLVPAIGVGVHYFGAVWQPAMVDKPPHVGWTGYGIYTLAFMCICGVTWFRRTRHEVLASGGSAYKQM